MEFTQSGVLPAYGTWGFCYGNNTWVGVNRTNRSATSTDGLTWASHALPSNRTWMGVAYGNGLFVSLAFNTNVLITSPDGATWTQRTMVSNRYWSYISFVNGVFLCGLQTNSPIVATSTDGITWVERTMPFSADMWFFFSGDGGRIIATANSPSGHAAYSDNGGVTWTATAMPTAASYISSAYNGDTFAALSATGLTATSPNGAAWTAGPTQTPPDTGTGWTAMCVVSGFFWAAGHKSGTYMYSDDGQNWTQNSSRLPNLGGTWGDPVAGPNGLVLLFDGSSGGFTYIGTAVIPPPAVADVADEFDGAAHTIVGHVPTSGIGAWTSDGTTTNQPVLTGTSGITSGGASSWSCALKSSSIDLAQQAYLYVAYDIKGPPGPTSTARTDAYLAMGKGGTADCGFEVYRSRLPGQSYINHWNPNNSHQYSFEPVVGLLNVMIVLNTATQFQRLYVNDLLVSTIGYTPDASDAHNMLPTLSLAAFNESTADGGSYLVLDAVGYGFIDQLPVQPEGPFWTQLIGSREIQ